MDIPGPGGPSRRELIEPGEHGHVIVCGLHGVGLRTVEQLQLAGVPVVVVDDRPDPRLVPVLTGLGVRRVTGSAQQAGTLAEAGLDRAVAVVCVESDDLRTLAAALLVRELRPELRVVVQLSNAAVGRALAEARIAVLDVAELSAPSVVEGCLDAAAHGLELEGEAFAVARVRAEQPGTLRERFGDLTPVAVQHRPAPGEEPSAVICPGRDLRVGPADTVWLFGTPAELHARGVPTGRLRPAQVAAAGMTGARAGHREGPRPGTIEAAVRSLTTSLVQATDRRLRLVLGALALLAFTSVLVLRLGYQEPDGRRMSVLDALYFTVETIATVGYGDFNFREQPDWLRGFAIALMVLGAVLATTFFALLTNLLVSRRLEESLGRRRVTGLSDHVIVVGLGSVGVRTVEGLTRAGVDVVVVEPDENNRYAAQVRALGVPVVAADATLPQTLAEVGIGRARAVAVLTSDDLTNLEAALAARDQLGERRDRVPIVLRLFDRQLAHTVGHVFGFRFVRSTAALAAPWFVGAALGLEVLNTFYVGGRPLLLGRLRVSHGLDQVAMSELATQLRVVALRRAGTDGLEHPVRRTSRFGEGDVAYLIGPYEQLLALLRRNAQPPAEVFPTS